MLFENVKLGDIKEIAGKILEAFPRERIFIFDAPMGAGKTTLISAMCRRLGVDDEPASPTFSIVNVYLDKEENEIFHFDFYRLKNIDEAFEIGFYEYFDSGNYCFVEWPDLITPYLPDGYVSVKITACDDNEKRTIEVKAVH